MTNPTTTVPVVLEAWACFRPDGTIARYYKDHGPLCIFAMEHEAISAKGAQEVVRVVGVRSAAGAQA
jgi:hypothetical protein